MYLFEQPVISTAIGHRLLLQDQVWRRINNNFWMLISVAMDYVQDRLFADHIHF
jgi:intracellular septation protein A